MVVHLKTKTGGNETTQDPTLKQLFRFGLPGSLGDYGASWIWIICACDGSSPMARFVSLVENLVNSGHTRQLSTRNGLDSAISTEQQI